MPRKFSNAAWMFVAITIGVELAGTRKYTTRGSELLFSRSVRQVDESGSGAEAQNEATSPKPLRQARQSAGSAYVAAPSMRRSVDILPKHLERHGGAVVGGVVGGGVDGTGLNVGGGTVGAADARVGARVGQPVSSDPSAHWTTPSHSAVRAQSWMHSLLAQRYWYEAHSPGVSVTVITDSVGQTLYASSLPSLQLQAAVAEVNARRRPQGRGKGGG